jgi:signal transduction histidine kinase
MDSQAEIASLKRELEYYKTQLDVYSGETIRNQYNLAQMANQLTQLRNGYTIIDHLQQAYNAESPIKLLYENLFELILQRLHMDRIVVMEHIGGHTFKPWMGKGFTDEQDLTTTLLLPAELCIDKSTLLINGKKKPIADSADLRTLLKCPFVIACAYIRNKQVQVLAVGRKHERQPMSYAAFTEIDVFVLAGLAGIINGIETQISRQNELEEERTRIARDMHDDLGSDLSKIALYTELLHAQNVLDEKVLLYTQRIKSATNEVIENLGNIVWAINPENNNLQNLIAYLREFCADYLEIHGIRLTVNSSKIPNQVIRAVVRKNVLMVTKEVLRNCVKHAKANSVSVTIQVTTTHLIIKLMDDGIGISGTRQFGNGLNNMKKRIADIAGVLEIGQNDPSGTAITMQISLT